MLDRVLTTDYLRDRVWAGGTEEHGFSLPDVSTLADFDQHSGVVVESALDSGNRILLSPARSCPHPLRIPFHPGASNNLIVIGENTNVFGQIHVHGSGSLIVFAGNVHQWSMVNVRQWSNGQVFFWGQASTSNGCDVIMQGANGRVLVGDDCMFANDIFVRNSDMHPMVDLRSGAWINKPGDVVIEPHVWVAQEALISKKVRVGRGSIIGAKSLVNRSVPMYSLVAGVPARIARA